MVKLHVYRLNIPIKIEIRTKRKTKKFLIEKEKIIYLNKIH